MKKYMVNMVHPRMIVQQGLKGCNNARTVTNFAQKFGVPYVWWKPTASQKIMLVDWTQFRDAWKQAYSGYQKSFGTKDWPKTYGKTYGRTYAKTYGKNTRRTSQKGYGPTNDQNRASSRTNTFSKTRRTNTRNYRTATYNRTRRAA